MMEDHLFPVYLSRDDQKYTHNVQNEQISNI